MASNSALGGRTPVAWLLLGMAVLVAHWLLLQHLPMVPQVVDKSASLVFITRTIGAAVPVAPVTPVAAAPVEPVAPAVQRKPATALSPALAQALQALQDMPDAPSPADVDVSATPPISAAPPSNGLELDAPTPRQPSDSSEPSEPSQDPSTVQLAIKNPLGETRLRHTQLRHTQLRHTQLPSTEPSEPPPILLPAPVRLLYDVAGQAKRFNYSARAQLQWQHDASSYDLRFEVSAFLVGSRVQTSQGFISPLGLAPVRFSDKTRSERAAHFDYDKGQVTFSANSPDAALLPGAQDRLSVFIQLGALLAGQPDAYPPGTVISRQTIGPREADLWHAQVVGPERIQVQGQAMDTLKIMRLSEREFDNQVELWYAPTLGYVPVRIRLTQSNGDFADMQLRAVETP